MAGAPNEQRPRLRADALRNIERIIEAGATCLARDPEASVADIAKAAGVGRMTVYGHFESRADIVEAVVTRSLAEANRTLNAVDLTGSADRALARLVAATWVSTIRTGRLIIAAEKALPALRVRELHEGGLEQRVHEFLAGHQRDGTFRSDLPVAWLTAMFGATVHAAATEVEAGRLDPGHAADTITRTVLALVHPEPGRPAG